MDERLNGVEAHRLRANEPSQIVGRIVQAQPGALKGGAREGGGVRLGKSERRKGGDAREELRRIGLAHANGGDGAINKARAQERHLALGSRRAHRAAKHIRGTGGEARHLNGDAHHLFLVQDHAERLVENRCERLMRIGDGFKTRATTQVRVHRVSLNGSGANDGDLRDEVVHLDGARARQRLLLGAALDLKDANRVGGADGAPDLGGLLGEGVEVRLGPEIVLNQGQGVGDGGEDAEAEEVELYEL